MSANLPTVLTVKRVQEDTYPETILVRPISGIDSAVLEVEGLGTAAGTINLSAQTIDFAIPNIIANAAPATYDFDVVVTAGGKTRTVVQGSWIISARRVT